MGISQGAPGAIDVLPQGPEYDMFGRARGSEPKTRWEATSFLDVPERWDVMTAGSGSITHNADQACYDLAVSGTDGDLAGIQSHGYLFYEPGHSQLIRLTYTLPPAQANQAARVGYFDDDNGIFLLADENGLALGIRSSTSGSAVENIVRQENWNIDPMDGTGPSRHTLDRANAEILYIAFQFLGVGSVALALEIDAETHFIHRFDHANRITGQYMQTGSLPIRYELENTGAAGAQTLKAFCSSVIVEGGGSLKDRQGRQWVAKTGGAGVATTTAFRGLVAIRLKSTFGAGGPDNRNMALPTLISVLDAGNKEMELALLHNATITGSPAWSDIEATESGLEYTTDFAFTGGREFWGDFVTGGEIVSLAGALLSDEAIHRAYDGTSDVLVLAARTLSATGTAYAKLGVKEFYR